MNPLCFASREEIESVQLAGLRSLIGKIYPQNSFWSQRLRDAGLQEGVRDLTEFRNRLPFTVKAELIQDQRQHGPYGTNLTWPLEHYVRLHQTSGTTGAPLHWLDTAEDWAWMRAGWREVLEAAGVSAADRLFFAFSFGPYIGFWLAFEAGMEMGALCIPGGAMNSIERLQAILDHEVTVLGCTPTYALRLGELALEQGLDLRASPVRAIVVGGEPGGSVPATRARIEEIWSARVYDHHGMTETGPITYACPDTPDVVHALESSYLCELVDPHSGEPVEPGTEIAELVVTTLGRAGSPVLRYRTGDLVRAAPHGPCACGRTALRFTGGVLSRSDDMIVVRGVNLFPSAVEQIVRGNDNVAEYRVEIDESGAMTEVALVVEPRSDRTGHAALCDELQSALHRALQLRVTVSVVAPGELPRFDRKAHRWMRMR